MLRMILFTILKDCFSQLRIRGHTLDYNKLTVNTEVYKPMSRITDQVILQELRIWACYLTEYEIAPS